MYLCNGVYCKHPNPIRTVSISYKQQTFSRNMYQNQTQKIDLFLLTTLPKKQIYIIPNLT